MASRIDVAGDRPFITFMAWHGDQYISLADVIGWLGAEFATTTWRLIVDEASGPAYDHLSAIDTRAIERLADTQIIDGYVETDIECDPGYLIIRAVDSSHWDILGGARDITRPSLRTPRKRSGSTRGARGRP